MYAVRVGLCGQCADRRVVVWPCNRRSGPRRNFRAVKRGEDAKDFIRSDDGTGVVWEIDFESGVHVLIRVAGGRVFHHRDLIAEFGGIANSSLHTGVGDQSDDDELVNAVFLELHIQIRVGETAGTPMLRGHHIACVRFESGANLAAPGAIFERPPPCCFLNWSNVVPRLVVAETIAPMHRIENPQTGFSRRVKNLFHMRNTLVPFRNALDSIPYFAVLRDEVVIRIDQDKPRERLFIGQLWHISPGNLNLAVMHDVRCFLRTLASPAGYEPLKSACARPGIHPAEFPAFQGNPAIPVWHSSEPYW